MTLLLTKITDVIRSLAISLQFSMLIPAMLLVVGMVWLLSPASLEVELATAVIVGAASLVISYILNAFNMPIIRLFEGYIMGETPPARALRAVEMTKFLRHHNRVQQYIGMAKKVLEKENSWRFDNVMTRERQVALDRWRHGWESRIDHERERLEERFPPSPEYLLPTGLGNTIAAFEHYPHRRYRIDMIQLWPRFVPTLLGNQYAGFIEGEKAILDFLINILFCGLLIWPVSLGVFAFTGRLAVSVVLFAVPAVALVVYKGACVAAVNWGYTVKSAFDLYRFDLARTLHLKRDATDVSLSAERAMWQGISEFLAFGRLDNFEGFDYQSTLTSPNADPHREER